ncbi:MAG TPA: PAS domain S-box protein [Burkholderiaceae bacterium]|nr:PAS domain S-box protein [Burkholderiaceae bacterium]
MTDPKSAVPASAPASVPASAPPPSAKPCEPLAAAHPALYPQIFEMAADAQLVSEKSGRIRLVNRQAERLFGYSGSELLELSIEDLIPHRFRADHQQHRKRYRQRPAARPMGLNLSLWALHRDGHEFPVEISLNPLLLDGRVFVCANVRDVSELHRARAVLSQARQTQAIADFGRLALSSQDLASIQSEACRLAALHLDVPTALLLRHERGKRALAVVANAGSTGDRENAGTQRRLLAAIADRIENGGVA